MKNISKFRLFILTSAAIFIADQVSKYLVRKSGTNFVKNYGAGFGILQNQSLLLIIVSFAVLAVIIYYYKKVPIKNSYQLFLGLIVGGLIGNLTDRIYLGFVTDFITLGFWPSFNIADTALSAGIIGIIIWMLKDKEL